MNCYTIKNGLPEPGIRFVSPSQGRSYVLLGCNVSLHSRSGAFSFERGVRVYLTEALEESLRLKRSSWIFDAELVRRGKECELDLPGGETPSAVVLHQISGASLKCRISSPSIPVRAQQSHTETITGNYDSERHQFYLTTLFSGEALTVKSKVWSQSRPWLFGLTVTGYKTVTRSYRFDGSFIQVIE